MAEYEKRVVCVYNSETGMWEMLTLFNEMCQNGSRFDETKIDRLAGVAGFAGTSEFLDGSFFFTWQDTMVYSGNCC